MPTPISITSPANAEALWIIRDRMKFMGDVPGTELAVVELEVPPGSGTPPHSHASPEVFRVLSGEVTFGIFAEKPPRLVVAGAGAVVTVPPHAPHNYHNTGRNPATMLVIVDRSMITFFRDLGRREDPPAGPPSDKEIAGVMAACARHHITLLSCPPA